MYCRATGTPDAALLSMMHDKKDILIIYAEELRQRGKEGGKRANIY